MAFAFAGKLLVLSAGERGVVFLLGGREEGDPVEDLVALSTSFEICNGRLVMLSLLVLFPLLYMILGSMRLRVAGEGTNK